MNRYNTVSSFSIVILMVALIFVQHVIAQRDLVPHDVLELRPEGYAYADYPSVFDNAIRGGITIEAWIYLTGKPKDADFDNLATGGQWVIFAKPGSYSADLRGRKLGSKFDMEEPDGTVYLQYTISPQPSPKVGAPGALLYPFGLRNTR